MTFNNLIIEKGEHGVTVVKISRPKALNALNTETLTELREALTKLSRDETVRVLILTGDGEKAFIAGADIAEMKDMTHSQAIEFARRGHEVTKLLELMPKPTIAAVNGFALGGGTEMAIACDFIVASEKAVFGQPEVSLGIIPGFGSSVRLARFVGIPRAKELIFSGRRIKADEAFGMGLVSAVFTQAEFMEKVMGLAKTISQQSLGAVVAAKQLLNEFSETVGLNFKLDSEAQSFGRLFNHPDQKEGMTAFIEKRPPKFQGL